MLHLGQLKDPVTAIVAVVMGLALSSLSVAVHVHLLVKEMGSEGVVGWDVRLLKATVVWVIVVCPPTSLTT